MLEAGDADSVAVGSQADWPQMDTLVGVECVKTTDDCQEVDPNKPLIKVTRLGDHHPHGFVLHLQHQQ